MQLILIDQEKAFEENQRILERFGWKIHKEGEGVTWYSSPETKQWSTEFPLCVLFELKQLLLTQPVAKAPPAKDSLSRNVVYTVLSTLPPPSRG